MHNWDHLILWDLYKIVTSLLSPLLQSLTPLWLPRVWVFMVSFGHEFLLNPDPASHLLLLHVLPILTSLAMEPRSSHGLPQSLLHILLNTWGGKWHLIHRNKDSLKDSHRCSCFQVFPNHPSTKKGSLITFQSPEILLSSRIPPFPPLPPFSVVSYFQMPIPFPCRCV